MSILQIEAIDQSNNDVYDVFSYMPNYACHNISNNRHNNHGNHYISCERLTYVYLCEHVNFMTRVKS